MTKAEARVEYLRKRQALKDADRDELNRQIYERVFASGYLDSASTIHAFLSMERTREPDTWKIIEKILPRKKVVIPRINEQGLLDHFYYEGLHQLKQSSLGILEPQQGIPATVNKIDLVIVPLVIFDVEGNRVGYGKGFYDRFLKDCRSDCKKIGISFFRPVEKLDDVEEHDVPLDACFTPRQLFEF
ncbi:MAG TPA: 5-formyltetrahydrofolate cyclo-ligase [Cyclobacteriaceae bacterium]|nr:5-formyltetrahydrofolate cyclo-ligase [Cyclobacteriaceae bacterium]